MYVVEARQIRAEMRTQTELDGILRLLAKQYVPILRSGAMAMLKACNTSTTICSLECAEVILKLYGNSARQTTVARMAKQAIVGDIFFRDNRMLALQPQGSRLAVWEIREHTASPHLEEFCDAVTKAANASIDGRRLRGMNFDWTAYEISRPINSPSFRNRNLTRPMSELVTKSAELSDETVGDANLLVSRERRDFLVRLAQLGKARSTDAQADVATEHVTLLIERGLVRKEFLVLCRKDSHTLCTVDSKDQLSADGSGVIRCPICGRLFSEELIQEIYALTDRARGMLDGSHWMTVWVTSILVESGISIKQILWGATSGEDEIDIIARMGNQSIFFELKDRMFGLGDAYPFTARVQRYGASAGVIISMDGIAEEVQRFLTEQARSLGRAIYPISGEKEVRTKVPTMLYERAKASATDTIKEAFANSGIDPTVILAIWSRKRSKISR